MPERQPESFQPALPDMPAAPERFNPEQRRAFGSIPTLLGKEYEVPPHHRLTEVSLVRTEPDTLRQGLYGVHGNNAVNGLALNTKQYEVVIRNQSSFMASIRNKTLAANVATGDLRTREKELKSLLSSLDTKKQRHETVLTGLHQEGELLSQLSEWQRTPGYWRTREADMRIKATQAWQGSFTNMMQVLRDQHELTPNEYVDMTNALAHKLFRGSQKDRIRHWGGMLHVASEYNRSVGLLFQNSERHIGLAQDRLSQQLDEFYNSNGLQPS